MALEQVPETPRGNQMNDGVWKKTTVPITTTGRTRPMGLPEAEAREQYRVMGF